MIFASKTVMKRAGPGVVAVDYEGAIVRSPCRAVARNGPTAVS